jgi:hypothetical protein
MVLYYPIFPNTLHEFKVRILDVAIIFQLDMFQRWFIHVYLIQCRRGFWLFSKMIGKADDCWIENHFDDDE